MQDDEEQMFVDIEDYKSPLKVEIILTPYKKGRLAPDKKSYLPKEPITPDICWEVLKSTNAPRSIKDMLYCIAELPVPEQAQFKEVVLSTFTQREQPDNILVLGKKLAVAGDYETDLSEVQKLKEGDFLMSSSELSKVCISLKNVFSDVDFSSYDKMIFLSSEEIKFRENVKFSKNLEFPNSSNVAFSFMDVPFVVIGSNFSGVQSISFKQGTKVNFGMAKNLPKHLDVSMCDKVSFWHCNFINVESLTFKNKRQMRKREYDNFYNWNGKVFFSETSLVAKMKSFLQKKFR